MKSFNGVLFLIFTFLTTSSFSLQSFQSSKFYESFQSFSIPSFQFISEVHAQDSKIGKGTDHEIAKVLSDIYVGYPSIKLTGDATRLKTSAALVHDKDTAEDLVKILKERPDAFLRARILALNEVAQKTSLQPKRTAYVSGFSIGGMVAAAILAKAGFEVSVVEKRMEYTRNIQWAGRQALIDELSSLDQELAEEFLRRIAKEIPKGSVRINEKGPGVFSRRSRPQPRPLPGDLTRIPMTGREMLKENSSVILECRVFEKMLWDYLKKFPNVKIHMGATIDLEGPNSEGVYAVVEHSQSGLNIRSVPDLVVIAEGPNSTTRDRLGIQPLPASPKRLQISGVVFVGLDGVMAKHNRMEDGEPLITGIMARDGIQRTWVVADVSSKSKLNRVLDLKPDSPEYRAMVPQIEAEFRRVAGASITLSQDTRVIQMSDNTFEEELKVSEEWITRNLNKMDITGAVDGTVPKLFILQQRISSASTAGNNVIGIGDFVGNGHWSVGGGMQIAAISHAERLKQLIFDLEQKKDKRETIAAYGEAVTEDSLVWTELGISAFYSFPEDEQKAARLYKEAVQMWKVRKVASPLEGMNLLLSVQK